MLSRSLVLALLPLLASVSSAQSNADPNIDVRLAGLRELVVRGRQGPFPTGICGIAFETTVCNEGPSTVPWRQAMHPEHPTIAFIVASVRNGRIEQISNRSYVKHGFFAANTGGCGTPCIQPLADALGIGCSDTYAINHNGDNFYLGPPEEIDPWLGTWTPACSFFDRGSPDVGAPANCDGFRSLTRTQANALGPIHSRVQVHDEDLAAPGELYFQAQYNVRSMPDAARDDSLGSRLFVANNTGLAWSLVASGALLPGTVLQRWPDSSLSSTTNGGDDGRVFVAVKVTGPVGGFYHYEYALHNRDNARGIGALRIPLCPGARVRAAGFRDVDRDPTSDWKARVGAREVVFETPDSPLHWNAIFNFWFDSDAAPGDAMLGLGQFEPGPGLAELRVTGRAPTTLYNVHLGPGCALDTPPTLYALGTPPQAALGNASFALASEGNAPFQHSVLYFDTKSGSRSLGGCTFWIAPGATRQQRVSVVLSDAQGLALHPAPIPNDVALEGQALSLQAIARDPGHGVVLGDFELSEGLRVRVGDAIPRCP